MQTMLVIVLNGYFLPTKKKEMKSLGWSHLDFLMISGDAYVDHPSFGTTLIARYLEYLGYRIGIIPQPNWRKPEELLEMGVPKKAIFISAGNLDSMLNHYTAKKNPRTHDEYSPGGQIGHRPDRATIVYTNMARSVFKDIPIIIGGIEASLRRFVHYDYWDDALRRSILFDSKADLLIYGMAEYSIKQLVQELSAGKSVEDLRHLPGICYISTEKTADSVNIPSYEECLQSKKAYAESFRLAYLEQDPIRGKTVVQLHQDRYLVQNPPSPPLSSAGMDIIYKLPYQRKEHPRYHALGGVPALKEVKFSITSHRGCFGACSFCALHFHQGRIVQNRTHQSIIAEAQEMTKQPDFKGYIHDVGGPTANFRLPACLKQSRKGTCRTRQCLFPEPCPNLRVDHSDYLRLLRALRKLPGVKKVFVRSGVRYDYLLLDKNSSFLQELCQHHISGQLKVAPEHASLKVTTFMGKPPIALFNQFKDLYQKANEKLKKKQYLIPYFMSGHPGTTLKDAVYLAEYLRDIHFQPEQVQEFIPTPGSISTCMYYTEMDPFSKKKIHIPKGEEKALQRALLQFKKPQNYSLVLRALKQADRKDLIGYGSKCLIKPPQKSGTGQKKGFN